MNENKTDKKERKEEKYIKIIIKKSQTEERKAYNLIYILINSIAMQK